MWESLKKEWQVQVTVFGFLILTVWWAFLNISGSKETFHSYIFGASYGLIAAWGGCWGIVIAKKWGGVKSIMGKAVLSLSLGLLAAEFGQLVFSYYNIFLNDPIPYPSLADVGFFSNIPLYFIGTFLLAKASGVKFTIERITHIAQIILIPLAMLSLSYFLFLQEYSFDWSDPLRVFLDFGYPLGQAIYVSMALLTYSLSKNILGGVMRPRIMFLLVAFVLQYIADFNFLYQNLDGTWLNGGYGDYLYLLAYFIMALGILQLKTIISKL